MLPDVNVHFRLQTTACGPIFDVILEKLRSDGVSHIDVVA